MVIGSTCINRTGMNVLADFLLGTVF